MPKVAAELDADHERADGARCERTSRARGQQEQRHHALDEEHDEERSLEERERHAAAEPAEWRRQRLRDQEVFDVARVAEGRADEFLLAKAEEDSSEQPTEGRAEPRVWRGVEREPAQGTRASRTTIAPQGRRGREQACQRPGLEEEAVPGVEEADGEVEAAHGEPRTQEGLRTQHARRHRQTEGDAGDGHADEGRIGGAQSPKHGGERPPVAGGEVVADLTE